MLLKSPQLLLLSCLMALPNRAFAVVSSSKSTSLASTSSSHSTTSSTTSRLSTVRSSTSTYSTTTSTTRSTSKSTSTSSKTSTSSSSSSTSKPTSTSSKTSTSTSTSTSTRTSTSSSASATSTGIYTLKDNYVGYGFLTGFAFETISDPTHGRVNYVDQSYATSKGLVSTTSNSFIMRADSETTLSPSGPGRNSIRIRSYNAYTQHLAVFDIRHMPQGCGTWPAAWETLESDWPNSGEVDILEGVNDQGPNAMTLHTSSNCTMPSSRAMTGSSTSTDCYWLANGNSGCGVTNNKANSYGPSFNTAGGGWYVLERTASFIRVFFWSRNDASVPTAVRLGTPMVSTAGWGTPVAFFPNTQCDLNTHFGSNNIIFDLTFCGDWAGAQSVYAASGCPGTCVDYVNNNPTAFKSAYWDVAAVRVYT